MIFAVGVVLMAVTWWVYAPSLRGGFVAWDDQVEVTANPHIESLDWAHVRWMFTNYDWVRRYQPLDWVSWAVTYRFWQRDPYGYHLGNLLEHLVSTLLIFGVIRKIMVYWAGEASRGAPVRLTLCAGLGALWWAVHPLRVEPVAWVTGRIYTQCAMCLWGSLLAYLYAADEALPRYVRRTLYWVAVGAFAAALLSYAIVVGAAVALVVLDIYPLRRFGPGGMKRWLGRSAWPIWLEKVPFFVTALGVGMITLWARVNVTQRWEPPPTLADFGLLQRAMQACYTWVYYLWITWQPTHLSPVYTRLVWFNPLEPVFLLSALVVIGGSVAWWRWRGRYPGILALWVFHLVMLVPVLGLTEHPHYTNDRYAHMPSLAWAVLIAGGLWAVDRRFVGTVVVKCGYGAVVALVLVFGWLATLQTGVWRNSETLFGYMIGELGEDPYRIDIHWRLAQVYLERGQLREAVVQCEQTLRVNPGHPQALYFKGMALMAAGEWAQAQQEPPENVRSLYTEAAAQFDLQVKSQPAGQLFGYAGLGYLRAGAYGLALDRLTQAAAKMPRDAVVRLHLAEALGGQGQIDEAKKQAAVAVALDPRCAAEAERLRQLWAGATRPGADKPPVLGPESGAGR